MNNPEITVEEKPLDKSTEKIGTILRKKKFVEAFKNSGGNITAACERAGIDRMTYYLWVRKNPKFIEEMKSVEESIKDYVESKLMEQIRKGNPQILMFYAKTKMRDRGYSEVQEINIKKTEISFSLEDLQKAYIEAHEVKVIEHRKDNDTADTKR